MTGTLIHGMWESRTYQVWANMKTRCLNPRHRDYHKYGGRGITVCERWLNFQNFLADMGEQPKGLTIERINNHGNYEPQNCKWATYKEQSQNQRHPKRKGYSWDRHHQKYQIRISKDGILYHFGYCKTEQGAIRQVKVARLCLDVFPRASKLLEKEVA